MSDRVSQRKTGKVLALDVGLKRIGVAVCDPLHLAARPLTVLHRRSRNDDFAELARLVKEQEAEAVLCGLPLNMDGSESERSASVRKWAMKLAFALRVLTGAPIAIIFWDERLSTFAANQVQSRQWNAGFREIVEEDAGAAAVILQNYLDAQTNESVSDFGRIVLPEKKEELDSV